MKLVPFAAALVLFGAPSFAGSLHAPAAPSQPATSPAASDDAGSWLDDAAGKKFFAVDGSSVMLTPNEGGFALNTVTPDGMAHDTTFNMLSDTLGSITEGDDKTVTGVFHVSGNTIEANFADGRTETVASNAAGGLTVLLNAPDAKSWCMKWYPQGHGFDDADKKQALAEYASKLGLATAAPRDHIVTRASCIDGGSPAPAQQTAAASQPTHGLAQPINVRTSQVHPIDVPAAPEPAQIVAPPALTAPAPAKTADIAADRPLIQSHGASSCLKIDNDGTSWGFRNSCGYGVQFAWCLQNGSDHATACGTGTGSGSLASNGFVALLPANVVVDADNQFRWVACNGGNDVSAQLDRSDPPAGRCVITSQQ